MKRFKKEWLLLAVAIVIAVAGLLQFFHEEAYAIGYCNDTNCRPACSSLTHCLCQDGLTVTTCATWCPYGTCVQ